MNALSNSRCQGVSGANGMARLRFARGLDGEQLAGDVAHGAFGLRLGLCPARAAERVERRTRLARADVLADQVRLGHRHVELRRRLRRIARRVFDDQAFLAALRRGGLPIGLRSRRLRRHGFASRDNARCRVAVNHVVALLQFREINVQRRARRLRVRRLEPARPLHLVAPENLRVGDDDQLGLVAKKAAGERADVQRREPASRLYPTRFLSSLFQMETGCDACPALPRPYPSQISVEPLPLAVVVAEDMNGVALAQPAMQLGEELAPLRFGYGTSSPRSANGRYASRLDKWRVLRFSISFFPSPSGNRTSRSGNPFASHVPSPSWDCS